MMTRNAEMHGRSRGRNVTLAFSSGCHRVTALLILALLASQPACFFKKKKPGEPAGPVGPVRMVILPLDAVGDSTDIRWISLAAPVLMARLALLAPSLELVPLWQSMPVAVESAGASRSITPEAAAYVASRMAARWAIHGEVRTTKGGVSILVDFIPTQPTSFPFRYTRDTSVGSLGSNLLEAYNQFLYYLIAKPVAGKDAKSTIDPALLREVAEALDREYGWFVQAEPGKAEKAASGLLRVERRLAPLVFNPSLYPVLNGAPASRAAGSSTAPALSSHAVTDSSAQPATPSEDTVNLPPAQAARPAGPTPQAQEKPAEAPTAPLVSSSQQVESAPETTASGQSGVAAQTQAPDASSAANTDPTSSQPLSSEISPASPSPPKFTAGIAPQATSAGSSSVPASTVRIQVSSWRDRAGAEGHAGKLAKNDLKPVIREVDLGEKGIWHRVILTGFPSREAAIETAKSLQARGLIREFLLLP